MEHLDLLLFAVTCLALMSGFPVAFSLSGVALLFGLLGLTVGHFDSAFFSALPQRIFGVMTNEVLVAVPLFVFMGTMLERARIAEDLLENMTRLFGGLRGGLAVSVTLVGALLAASTGIVGATVVTMGLLSLPTMLKRNYDPALASGAITAAGTLGQIIPPSIVLVLLGDVIANAYQKAQLEQGIFSPETVSVGELFAGSIIPGLILVGLYCLYQIGTAIIWPDKAPPAPEEEPISLSTVLKSLMPPIFLIVAVLGSILGGIATPTEAAAVGAIGTILLAGERISENPLLPRLGALSLIILVALTSSTDLRITRETLTGFDIVAIGLALALCGLLALSLLQALRACWTQKILLPVMQSTTNTTSMVFIILVGAALFSLVFRGLGGDETIKSWLEAIPGGEMGAVFAVMLVIFFLGFFLDFIEIIFVVVPIVGPVLLTMDIDPVWLGVMMAINLQTSFLTPPFGFALFYLRGVAPPSVATLQIYRGAIPYVAMQLGLLVILAMFPEIITWLPEQIFE
jgi:TRAP-type mannitol/chloroaromatic compound transport system permease large subunit